LGERSLWVFGCEHETSNCKSRIPINNEIAESPIGERQQQIMRTGLLNWPL
jgi:hypothetical protein